MVLRDERLLCAYTQPPISPVPTRTTHDLSTDSGRNDFLDECFDYATSVTGARKRAELNLHFSTEACRQVDVDVTDEPM